MKKAGNPPFVSGDKGNVSVKLSFDQFAVLVATFFKLKVKEEQQTNPLLFFYLCQSVPFARSIGIENKFYTVKPDFFCRLISNADDVDQERLEKLILSLAHACLERHFFSFHHTMVHSDTMVHSEFCKNAAEKYHAAVAKFRDLFPSGHVHATLNKQDYDAVFRSPNCVTEIACRRRKRFRVFHGSRFLQKRRHYKDSNTHAFRDPPRRKGLRRP